MQKPIGCARASTKRETTLSALRERWPVGKVLVQGKGATFMLTTDCVSMNVVIRSEPFGEVRFDR
jgi:hypothetical protein